MSLSELSNFYDAQPEPLRGIYLFLRSHFLAFDSRITEEWKYRLPFFYFNGKMFCYLWKDKKTQQPYIGFAHSKDIDHPMLDQGDRKRFKVFHISTNDDIEIDSLNEILEIMRDRALMKK